MKINVLPQSIANMIAAGEVVERPASVVKELAENSVDAGAKSITIEIKKGGMSYIRITDDGCGIAPDEVLTAFLRHATSKIKTEEDLNSIYTLGFRGEALASVAAVARVDIFTKQKQNELGYSASICAGEVTESGEAGCPDGTTITVRDLFFNTPARMKFLKSDATETSYVTDVVHKLILAHPELCVKLIVNGKTTLTSAGDGLLESSVRTVFGRDYVKHLNKLDYKEDGISITGLTGTNALARKDRRAQVFFINGRYIKSKLISAALGEAYQNTMMVGKFPVAVININVSAAFLDVNVHPTKMEVRFSDDKKIYSAVYWAVKNALSEKKYIPEIHSANTDANKTILEIRQQAAKEQNKAVQTDINLLKDTYVKNKFSNPQSSSDKDTEIKETKTPVTQEKRSDMSSVLNSHIERGSFFGKSEMQSFKNDNFAVAENIKTADVSIFDEKSDTKAQIDPTREIKPSESASESADRAELEFDLPDIKKTEIKYKTGIDFALIGQVFGTYIIVQKDDQMLIIDQHAAHERIYFEELVEQYKNKEFSKQLLMVAETVQFDPIYFDIAQNNLNVLSSLGYECEPFGENSLIIRATPGFMPSETIASTVTEIVELIAKGTKDIKKTLMEDILHTMACKKALKGNTYLTKEKMASLCEAVLSFDSINTCPHGRPIITSMSKKELEKSFKRIV